MLGVLQQLDNVLNNVVAFAGESVSSEEFDKFLKATITIDMKDSKLEAYTTYYRYSSDKYRDVLTLERLLDLTRGINMVKRTIITPPQHRRKIRYKAKAVKIKNSFTQNNQPRHIISLKSKPLQYKTTTVTMYSQIFERYRGIFSANIPRTINSGAILDSLPFNCSFTREYIHGCVSTSYLSEPGLQIIVRVRVMDGSLAHVRTSLDLIGEKLNNVTLTTTSSSYVSLKMSLKETIRHYLETDTLSFVYPIIRNIKMFNNLFYNTPEFISYVSKTIYTNKLNNEVGFTVRVLHSIDNNSLVKHTFSHISDTQLQKKLEGYNMKYKDLKNNKVVRTTMYSAILDIIKVKKINHLSTN